MSGITYFGSASNPADNGSFLDTSNPCVVTPPSSMVSGQLVVVQVALNNSTTTRDIAISNTGGQTWNSFIHHGSPLNYALYWCQFNGTWSANPSWSHGSAALTTGFSVVMEVFSPSTGGSPIWAVDVADAVASFVAPGSPFDVTTTGQTPVSANTVTVAIWAGGPGTITWSLQTAGWSNPSGQTQWRNTAGCDFSVAYKIQASAGATGNVINRQSSTSSGWQDIITFTDGVAAPNALMSWPKQTFVTETILQY
jgi:hypothetical protein